MQVVVSIKSFRTLSGGLKALAPGQVKHTVIMEIVAGSLGWRLDALMHHLKKGQGEVTVPEGFSSALLGRVYDAVGHQIAAEAASPLFENFLQANGGVNPCDIGSDDEWRSFRQVAHHLEAGLAEQAFEAARSLDETAPVNRLLKGLIGIALGHVVAQGQCISALKSNPELVFPLANLSGINLHDPIKPLQDEQPWDQIAAIKRLDQHGSTNPVLLAGRGLGGGYGHKGDGERLSRIIGVLRRPDLKGAAYRIVMEAAIPVPTDFTPYLDPSIVSKDPLKVICLINGTERKMLKLYLRTKFAIEVQAYRDFFGDPNLTMVSQSFAAEKSRYAQQPGSYHMSKHRDSAHSPT